MRALSVFAMLLGLLAAPRPGARAGTYRAAKTGNIRKLQVTRRYKIPVLPRENNVAAVPALLSFRGATNQQVITRSEFSYSLQPDRIEITADNRGMVRRNYELTWDSPNVSTVTVTQKLVVELACSTVLATAAALPYPEELRRRFAGSLGRDKLINPDNRNLEDVAREILGKSRFAEEAVELACDWVNDNIQFKSGSDPKSDTVLGSRRGNCTGMANLACAILRKMGVPAETVSAMFVGGGGHSFMEAYFPDAGWVFYDLSNANRAFKSLDCLLTTGWAFRVKNSKGERWHEGYFCRAKDTLPYQELRNLTKPILRSGPRTQRVIGARVVRRKTPPYVNVRQRPISGLIMDLSVPPGPRQYKGQETAATASRPSRDTNEEQAATKLKLARMYQKARMQNKAAEIYRVIIEKYPKTQAAKTARDELRAP